MSKYLSRPEEFILLSVMKLNDNAYGVSIRKMVQKLTGKYWSVGAVYVPLERLEQKGYVKSFSSEPLSERGGRRKRLFQITSAGISELEKKLKPLYTSLVDFLLEAMEKPGVGYLLRFKQNEEMESIPYIRFQAMKISKVIDFAFVISTRNDAGTVFGFYYRGLRLDIGISGKLHELTKNLKGAKISLFLGFSVPLIKKGDRN